jgi:hypothetical protein
VTTVFDELDLIAARSVGTLLNEPVKWRPQAKRLGGAYTVSQAVIPDPVRPVRELQGITSWQPDGVPIDPAKGGGEVSTGTLLVDLATEDFEGEFAGHGKPMKGDRLELPHQDPPDRLVEINRVGDDGSQRILLWCSVVKS